MQHVIFPDILNKGVYGILFTLTQNAYLYTPVFSYALYISVFIGVPPAYKIFISRIQLCTVIDILIDIDYAYLLCSVKKIK